VFGSNGSLVVENTTPTAVIGSSKAGVVADKPHATFVERYREAFIAELSAFVASSPRSSGPRRGGGRARRGQGGRAARTSHLEHGRSDFRRGPAGYRGQRR